MALLSIDRALELLLEQVTPKEEESVATSRALGRILSAGVHTPCAYPHEANSAMDGYALAAGDGPGRWWAKQPLESSSIGRSVSIKRSGSLQAVYCLRGPTAS